MALCRDIADPLVYSEEVLWDAHVRALAGSVELAADGERFGKPGGPAAEVSLTVAGATHTFAVTDWKGAPGNPCSYDDMAGKFRRYAAPCLPPDRIETIVEKVARLEDVGDVAELASLLRGG